MRESHNPDTDRMVVKAILEGNNLKMFQKLQEKYNLKYNIEVFHYILKKIYELEFEEDQ